MREYIIVTDTFCDMSMSYCEQHGIEVMNATYTIEGKDYKTNAPDSLTCKQFYDELRAGKQAQTAQVNIEDLTACFERIAASGKDVFYFSFSSALSGSYQTSTIAAADVMEKYPDCKIVAVDSLCASMGEGLMLEYCRRLRDRGLSLDELKERAEADRQKFCHFFTVDDLGHLHRGGRVSKLTAVVGGALGIKPVLHVNENGQLIAYGKVRGRKASFSAMVDSMAKVYEPSDMPVYISHSDVYEDAEYLAGLLRDRFGELDILIGDIGPTIGSHVGPGTMALFCFGKDRSV